MLDGVERIDLVERRVREGQLLRVHDTQSRGDAVGDCFGVEVDARCSRREALYALRDEPAATAHIENPVVSSRPQVFADAPEMAVHFDRGIQERVFARLIGHPH